MWRYSLLLWTYRGSELQVVAQVWDGVDQQRVVVLKGDRKDGGEEALRKIMQHFPLPTKLYAHGNYVWLFCNSDI